MIRWVLCLLLAAFALPTRASAYFWSESLTPKAERAKKLLEGFGEVVEASIADFDVPGMAIAVVVDGHPIFVKGFGVKNVESGERVTSDTLFRIGSCTKAFTAFAIGCLVDEGLLSWDTPVVDLLPEFRMYDDYATRMVTLRDLLCHRSGLPRHNFMWYNSSFSRQEILHRIRYLEPACEVRERFNYNDLMYLVAGLALERVAQKSWEEVVAGRILTPLGMSHTTFTSEETGQIATPYLEKEGKLKEMPFRDFSKVGPAAGMNSSASDLTKWIQMQLNHGAWNESQLISHTSLKEMHAPQVIVTGYPDSKESQVNAYGLGWYVQSYRGHYNVNHFGGLDGFTSIISLLPEQGIGVVVLCNKNLTALPGYIAMNIFDRLLELPPVDWLKEGLEGLVKGKEADLCCHSDHVNRKKGTVPSHLLKEYTGIYSHPGYGNLAIELIDGDLHAIYNKISYHLDHWHYDTFSVIDESEDLILSRKGIKMTFRNHLNGDVDELLVPFEWSAPDIVFKKMKDESQSQIAYLKQYAGLYEVYGYTVEVALRDHVLFAMIPGQPHYELIPGSEHEFTVKSMPGYNVRFVTDEDEKIQEILLILPYGVVYSAKPKISS